MKEFIIEFLKILANSILLVCFALCSFLLVLNIFHSKEISYNYSIDLANDFSYNNYKKSLISIDKKMESVNYNIPAYATTAKPIYQYYKSCVDALNGSAFNQFSAKSSINAYDLYKANEEIVSNYSSVCAFNLAYNISIIDKSKNFRNDFDKVMKDVELKRDMVIDNSNYLMTSGLSNSSYGFSTDMFKSSIFNKVSNDFRLTVNNYETIASILEDVADWYVLEFGGNN